jgi:ketosteroid isomerase-like protein
MIAVEIMTPAETMASIAELVQAGQAAAAANHYADNAILMITRDCHAIGRAAIRYGFGTISNRFPCIVINRGQVVRRGSIALHTAQWIARGADQSSQSVLARGTTSAVLELGNDGRWLVPMENPWGGPCFDA